MRHYIVLEGGGTKTEGLLVSEMGDIAAWNVGLGTNPIYIEKEVAIGRVVLSIQKLMMKAGLEKEAVNKVYLFIPGMKIYEEDIANRLGMPYEIQGDEWPAFYGALGGTSGIVALSGTGSFVMGRSNEDCYYTVGGWGPFFGDEGSGYSIGIECLRYVAKVQDEGEEGSLLCEKVKAYFEIDDINQLKSLQREPSFNRENIAGLAKIVSECAKEGDREAIGIIETEAYKLAQLIKRMSCKMSIQQEVYPYTLVGGISKIGHVILEPLKKYVADLESRLVYTEPVCEPVVGAVFYILLANHPNRYTEQRKKEIKRCYDLIKGE